MRNAMIVAVVAGALALAGCGKEESTGQAASPASGVVAVDNSATADAAILASAAAARDAAAVASEAAEIKAAVKADSHNYAIEQDGEYGYKSGLSDQDRAQGTVTKPLAMVRYRGQIKGAYTVDSISGDGLTLRLDCADPCEYVRMRGIARGQVLDTKTIENSPDSLAHDIFEDAMDGKLKVYGKKG